MQDRMSRRVAALKGAARGMGLFALLTLLLAKPAEGKGRRPSLRRAKQGVSSPRGRSAVSARQQSARHLYRSPRGRRWVQRGRGGSLLLDGRPLFFRGRQVGRPVWRQDGQALAVLRRYRHHLQLVVLTEFPGSEPLTWRVPSLVGRRPHIQWLGPKAVGLGKRPLVPRVVFRWTTHLARR